MTFPDSGEWFRRQPCSGCGAVPYTGKPFLSGNYPCRCLTRHHYRKCETCGTVDWYPRKDERCGEVSMGSADGGVS